jgi:hypothetical protein
MAGVSVEEKLAYIYMDVAINKLAGKIECKEVMAPGRLIISMQHMAIL